MKINQTFIRRYLCVWYRYTYLCVYTRVHVLHVHVYTCTVRANTEDRAPNTLVTRGYVCILVCTVCFQWNIHTNRVHYSEHRVETTDYGAGGYLQERTNYELLRK